ncbi:hypothetical protein LTR17_017845 [Elasticomyces elasticus]|nr:hypothetical protein LTR17_017845 [Elasticomyces elasticus]
MLEAQTSKARLSIVRARVLETELRYHRFKTTYGELQPAWDTVKKGNREVHDGKCKEDYDFIEAWGSSARMNRVFTWVYGISLQDFERCRVELHPALIALLDQVQRGSIILRGTENVNKPETFELSDKQAFYASLDAFVKAWMEDTIRGTRRWHDRGRRSKAIVLVGRCLAAI